MENFNNFNDYNNNYNQQNNNMYTNIPQGQYTTPPVQKYKGWKTASLILGILSLLSCLLFFISIPLGFFGLITAIIYGCLAKKVCFGVWLNIGSMILSFCLIFVIVMFLAFLPSSDIPIETSHSMEFTNPIQNADSEELNIFENLLLKFSDSIIGKIEENSSKLQGTWELIDYNDDIIEGKEKIVKCTFNEDNTFTWNKYDDEENNYAKGIYKINGLYVENNEWEYVVDLKVTEFAIDGKIQTEPFTEEYEIYIVVEEDKTEALFYNINAKNYFYSQK